MRSTFAPLAFAALAVAAPAPSAVSSAVSPSSSPPAGCSENFDGPFKISVIKSSSKRSLQSRQNNDDTALVITLKNGVLTDAEGRTGYIAANQQFQFDSPPQAGAIYTAGFSICQNGDLAIGDDTTWYQCLSGTFYNLYDKSRGGQCDAVSIMAIGANDAQPTGAASQIGDGQVTGSAVAPVTQISDGQIQATTSTPLPPVTQISDGQIQATTATPAPVPITQISDGQIQATTATPAPPVCTEYKDGQPQCNSAAPYPTGTGGVAMPTGTGAMTSAYGPIATGAAAINGPAAGLLAVAGFAWAMI